ncbi:hypothetical protein GF367_03465 [Candidatus Woesearchaeota archaeon]|nr:hypothetical protein [Candidatus Woesearchaeota archaeon]
MRVDAERLREKGWSEAEITHAQGIVTKAKKRRYQHRNALDEAVYWGLLVLSAGTMVAVAYWIIPLFIFASSKVLYPLLILIGLSFGMLFTVIIKDLDHLKTHHHIILVLIVPITGKISFLALLGSISNAESIGGIAHSPVVAGAAFIISFLAPYLFHLLARK